MNVNIYNQFYNLLIFIITGIVLGILFDIFRIIRKSFKTPDFITYIEDIIFWIVAGSILLFSIFQFNNGEIRNYVIIGLILGSSIYLLTISKYFIKINVKLLNLIKSIIEFPIQLIYQFLDKILLNPINKLFHKMLKKAKNFSSKNKENEKKDKLIDNYKKIEQ